MPHQYYLPYAEHCQSRVFYFRNKVSFFFLEAVSFTLIPTFLDHERSKNQNRWSTAQQPLRLKCSISTALSMSKAFSSKRLHTYGQVLSNHNWQVSVLWIQATFQTIKLAKAMLVVSTVSLATDLVRHLEAFQRPLPVCWKKCAAEIHSELITQQIQTFQPSIQLFTQRSFYMRIFDITCFKIYWSTWYDAMPLACSPLGDRSLSKQSKKRQSLTDRNMAAFTKTEGTNELRDGKDYFDN